MSDLILKVMVLGDAGVGKSHLSHLYARRQAVYTERPTAGFDFIATKLKVETGQEVKVQLLDTSGNEKYRTALLPHMAVASGALVVYSVSDRKSFEHVQSWIDNFSSKANKGSEPVMLLVGNKTDQERVVSTEEGRELAMKNGILFVETNTSNKPSVDEAFNLLIADTYYATKSLSKKAPTDGRRPSVVSSMLQPQEGASQSLSMASMVGTGNLTDLLSSFTLQDNPNAEKGFFGGAFDWMVDGEESDEWEFEDEEWLVPDDNDEEKPPPLQPRTVYRSESGKIRRLTSRKSTLRRNSSRIKEDSAIAVDRQTTLSSISEKP